MKKDWIDYGVDASLLVFILALVSAFVSIAVAAIVSVWRAVLS